MAKATLTPSQENTHSILATAQVAVSGLEAIGTVVEGNEELEDQGYQRPEITNLDDIASTIEALEIERDRKAGINRTTKDGVLIRDAREVEEFPTHSTEAFEMNYLNLVRAAADVMGLEGIDNTDILVAQAKEFLKEFHTTHDGQSQSDIADAFNKESEKLIKTLNDHGIEDAPGKLDIAANYQGLNDENYAISTFTTLTGDNGKKYTIETTSIPHSALTEEQKKEFESIKADKPLTEKPVWFQKLSQTERDLCVKYADKIIAGHMIPTQLVNIPGIRNSYETVTRLHSKDETGKAVVQELDRNFHSGTVASLNPDDMEGTRLTQQNIEQAHAMMNAEHPGGHVHINTLNASNGNSNDKKLLKRIATAATRVIGASHTNTCFNGGRAVGGSNHDGVTLELQKFAQNDLGMKGNPSLAEIQNRIETIRVKARNTKLITRQPLTKETLSKLTVLEHAADLATNLQAKQATQVSKLRFGLSVVVGLVKTRSLNKAMAYAAKVSDPENIDLKINENIQAFSNSLRQSTYQTRINNISMCKSGKDRRGLAGHNVSAQAIKRATGISIDKIDKALLVGGHTAHMAGAITAGGGGIGSMGTKSENLAGIPASRVKSLEPIIEKSAKCNKVKGKDNKKALKAAKSTPKTRALPSREANMASQQLVKKGQLEPSQKALTSQKGELPRHVADAVQFRRSPAAGKMASAAAQKRANAMRKAHTAQATRISATRRSASAGREAGGRSA